MIRCYLPFGPLRKRRKLSERALAQESGLARGCLRKLWAGDERVTVSTLRTLAQFFDCDIEILMTPRSKLAECSTVVASFNVLRDGFDSWKIHFFDLVDSFRRTLDPRLILLPPVANIDPKLYALLAAIVKELAGEAQIRVPEWANKRYFLPSPWFVSGIGALKASALLEAPLSYRNNNIFVHANFLARA